MEPAQERASSPTSSSPVARSRGPSVVSTNQVRTSLIGSPGVLDGGSEPALTPKMWVDADHLRFIKSHSDCPDELDDIPVLRQGAVLCHSVPYSS